ncbi:MAG: alpha/beta hydrolase family esterase [Planctomycetaceae bacterium]
METVPSRPSHGEGGEAGTFPDEMIAVDGTTREYRLVVPESLPKDRAVPLVFVFHGFAVDSKDIISRYSGFSELAAKEGFIVVYPQGLQRRWRLEPEGNIDLEFFDALYEQLTARYNIDVNRVYATGMSNGGFFSNLLAAKRSATIAAVAPHSAGLGYLANGIGAAHKRPVMIIHGTADRVVAVEQGRTARDLFVKEGHEVEYVELAGFHHFWAGHVDIAATIWEFFENHPMTVQRQPVTP